MDGYKNALINDMTWLGQKDEVVFLGQGITCGDMFYGTLANIPKNKCLEFPVAENLIMGSAIGLALLGYRPVVLFQRMDFMLIAADAIINHLALMPEMSGKQFTLPVIIRACIGSQGQKFDVGSQHRKDFSSFFDSYVPTFPYKEGIYKEKFEDKTPLLVIEKKDDY